MTIEEENTTSRRDMLKKSAVAGGVAWTAPILVAGPASAATVSDEPPVCDPTTVPAAVIDMELADASGSFAEGAQESESVQYVMEGSATVSDLLVDISAPGVYTNVTPASPALISGTVQSYFIHRDPPGAPNTFDAASGSISFPADVEIIGVIKSNSADTPVPGASARLNGTDPIFGLGSAYPTEVSRRTATGTEANDIVDLSVDRSTVTVRMHTGGQFVDQVRVLVACRGAYTIQPV